MRSLLSGGMDAAHLRRQVADLRRRNQELLEANGRLKDERTEARNRAAALERELELLRPELGRVLVDNERLREYVFPPRSQS